LLVVTIAHRISSTSTQGQPPQAGTARLSFEADPAINAAVIGQLASCAWVKAGHPLCLIGHSEAG
jgi:hypothetical protein